MAASKITVNDLRIFLMDKPELNPLLQGLQWKDTDIDQAIINTIDYFNGAPPPTHIYTVENFPFRYALTIGVAGYLLKSASINQAVNQLDLAVDGVQVNDYAKSQLFANLGAQYWTEFKELTQTIKVNQNISAAFGGWGSEFESRAR